MVEREGLLAKSPTEADETLEPFAIPPDTAGVMTPAIVPLALLGCPSLGVFASVRELEDKTHPARRVRNLTNLTPVEELRVVGSAALSVARDLVHPLGGRVEDEGLASVGGAGGSNLTQMAPQLVGEHQLEEHAAAKVKGCA